MDSLHLQWRMMHCVRRLKDFAERRLQPFCNAHGITAGQLRVLVCLHFEGPVTASRLAKQACMAGANNSAICKQLARQGLILRERASDDERQVVISLSNSGRALMQKLEREAAIQTSQIDLVGADYEQVLAGMEALLAMLEQDKEKAV